MKKDANSKFKIQRDYPISDDTINLDVYKIFSLDDRTNLENKKQDKNHDLNEVSPVK